MNVEIICIGDELLIGQVENTNASWLAEQFVISGFSVRQINTIADKTNEIINAFAEAFLRADIILVSGGLGPTSDDLTRDALCRYFDCRMKIDPVSLENITDAFGRRGLPLTKLNAKQAEIPEKCIPIPNKFGTSPGMWFEQNGKVLVALPGVPLELKHLFSNIVLARLKKHFKPGEIVYCNVLTQGLGESFLSERIHDWENALPKEISLAYLPQPGIVRIRLMAKGKKIDILKASINKQIENLNLIIPELIFGYNNDTIENIVGKMLTEREASLSTAESCTGGYLAHLITSVPGSSKYYKGTIVSYDNNIKINILGVKREKLLKYGAVSSQVVAAMAKNILKIMGTSYSIAVSGIAGPDGGTSKKPVGTTWIAISSHNGTFVNQFHFGDNREQNIQRAAITALNMLRKILALPKEK